MFIILLRRHRAMWCKCSHYHKGVELSRTSPEFWSALSYTQLNGTGPTVGGSWIHLAYDPTKNTRIQKLLFKMNQNHKWSICWQCTREISVLLQNNLKPWSSLYASILARNSESVIETLLCSISIYSPLQMQSSVVISLISLRDTSRHRQGSPWWRSSNEAGAASLLERNIFNQRVTHFPPRTSTDSVVLCPRGWSNANPAAGSILFYHTMWSGVTRCCGCLVNMMS